MLGSFGVFCSVADFLADSSRTATQYDRPAICMLLSSLYPSVRLVMCGPRIYSDVVLESGSVLESDLSTYFEDSDSNPLDSDSSPLNSNSDLNPRTRGVQELDSALYDLELINYLYFICYRYSMYRYMLFNF